MLLCFAMCDCVLLTKFDDGVIVSPCDNDDFQKPTVAFDVRFVSQVPRRKEDPTEEDGKWW